MTPEQMAARLQEIAGEIETLGVKADFSDEDMSRVATIQAEAVTLRSGLEAAKARRLAQNGLRETARETRDFLGTAVMPVPFNGNGGSAKPSGGSGAQDLSASYMGEQRGRMSIMGYAPAGRMLITEDADFCEAFSDGFGLLSAEKFKKLSSREYKTAYANYFRNKGDEARMPDVQRFALQEGIDDQGGYLVPPDWVAQLIRREPTPLSINSNVQTWDTLRDRVIFPKVKYTGASDDSNAVLYSTGMRVTYPGEVPADSTTIDMTEPTFGEIEVPVYTAMGAVSVSNNQLEDSPIAFQQFLMDVIGETVGLEYDLRILKGDGVGKARGIIANPSSSATADEPQYVVSGNATSLTADGLKNLAYSVAPQYLNNAKFVTSWLSGAKTIDELKDGDGNYMWSMGTQDNRLANGILDRRLLGFPVLYSEFMPAMAASAYPIIFGDLRGYLLARRLGMTVQVLRETKAKQNQVELVVRFRFGGKVLKPWALKVQKCSV